MATSARLLSAATDTPGPPPSRQAGTGPQTPAGGGEPDPFAGVSHPDSGLDGAGSVLGAPPPLVSEPPLDGAAPLTSEPPLAAELPLTSEPTAAVPGAGAGLEPAEF
ncbi:hypothetical protein ACZ90_13230 [Streptomyces albus subsp. albus]|nr:hypothetical protein ACZ90_13230 [Streptomyces albus subsp. albus]